jgi:hypothetical protein
MAAFFQWDDIWMAWVVDAILIRAFTVETWSCTITLNELSALVEPGLGCDTFAFLAQSQLCVKIS